MLILLTLVMFLAGVTVLTEAINKLERTDVMALGLTRRQRLVVALKGLGWFALALGAGGAIFSSLLPIGYVRLGYALTIAGFALLIARSRVRETLPGQAPIGSDEFERTVVINPATYPAMRAGLLGSTVLPDPHRDRIEAVLQGLGNTAEPADERERP